MWKVETCNVITGFRCCFHSRSTQKMLLWLMMGPIVVLFPPFICLAFVCFFLAVWLRRRFLFPCLQKAPFSIAFLHPACAAGGGGEGVLWTAIAAIQKSDRLNKKYEKIVIYTDRNTPTPEQLVDRVFQQFSIKVSHDKLELVPLYLTNLALRPESIPFLTLAAQAFFSMLLAIEALWKHQPNVMIDTTGLTFALPVFSWFLGKNCKIGAYVHYPWISTNMISVVVNRNASFNNRAIFARSAFLSQMKLYYYQLLAWAYAYAGNCAEVAMVNSMWTRDHVSEIWNSFPANKLHVVYPPVNVTPFLTSETPRRTDKMVAAYVAQFRPEKNHPFLLESYAMFLNSLSSRDLPRERYLLKLVGGCRSADDQERLNSLKKLAEKLGISDNVQFCVGIPHNELVGALVSSQIAVHPMVDEHFGIAVVEAMAAGLVVVAHDSGGPSRDILLPPDNNPKQPTGILVSRGCLDKDAFASALRKALIELSDAERESMTKAARQVAEQRFSSEKFSEGFIAAVEHLF